MFGFFRKKKQKQRIMDDAAQRLNQPLDQQTLSCSLEKNISTMKGLFADADLLRVRNVQNSHNERLKFGLMYFEGMVHPEAINNSVIKPLIVSEAASPGRGVIDEIAAKVVQADEAEVTESIKDIVVSICHGKTVLFANGAAKAVIINTKGFTTRNVTEPENERLLSGPREGFTESLVTNLSLLLRRVSTNEFKMKRYQFGKRTNTNACVCYIDGIVNKQILNELHRRLAKIDIDAVLDTNYLTELIRDGQMSPFRTIGYTEKPDVVAGKLLEGRIAILVDGSPVAITLPYLFIENFQSGEDYYLNFWYTSFSRALRILGFFLTIVVPALYVAIVAFHHEMMPTKLIINIAAERASVPLPAALEALVMLIVFDILRETGIRMPSNIGQALSIVGALVIGQAAVEAKLVAAPMIIVVAMTGITNLLVPKMLAPVIFARLFLLALASMFGFYGLVLGMTVILIHVLNLRSFGISQLTLTGNLKFQDIKDTVIRAPWKDMIKRPRFMAADRQRMKNGGQNE